MSADEHFRKMLEEAFPETTERAGFFSNYDAARQEVLDRIKDEMAHLMGMPTGLPLQDLYDRAEGLRKTAEKYDAEIAKAKRAARRNALDDSLRMANELFYSAEIWGLGKLGGGLLSRFMELFKGKIGDAIEMAMGKEESDVGDAATGGEDG